MSTGVSSSVAAESVPVTGASLLATTVIVTEAVSQSDGLMPSPRSHTWYVYPSVPLKLGAGV